MIISRTPFRISFLGGGTDYPEAVAKWGGLVLGTTINKYSYISCRELPPFFDYKSRLTYSKIETVCSNHVIEHKVIRNVIKNVGLLETGIEMSHIADLPGFSGTGSSSSFIVGLVHALQKMKNKPQYCVAQELYNSAVHIEQNLLNESVGYQDSAWAAFGGMNVIKWKEKNPQITKIYLYQDYLDYLQRSLMLFNTRISRNASEIASSYVPNITEKESEHKALLDLTNEGLEYLLDYDFPKFGEIVGKSWEVKQKYSHTISNPTIDELIDIAKKLGAYGCKLMGAGAGGCLFLVVRPDKREYIQKGLEEKGATHIPFRFEPEGSKIILEDK